jgi:hypothetical protein
MQMIIENPDKQLGNDQWGGSEVYLAFTRQGRMRWIGISACNTHRSRRSASCSTGVVKVLRRIPSLRLAPALPLSGAVALQ